MQLRGDVGLTGVLIIAAAHFDKVDQLPASNLPDVVKGTTFLRLGGIPCVVR